MKNDKKIVLTIAGSDSCGGAGIQADLKTFNALGVHGLTVITSVTVQNTGYVTNIYKIPVDIIREQIDVLMEDMQPDVVKTGMLYDDETIKCVSDKIKQYGLKTVVDPVFLATSGDSLIAGKFVETFREKMIPNAYVLTPNVYEAERLTDEKIGSIVDMKKSCKKLYDMGAENIIIKGGHLNTDIISDVFFNNKKTRVFSLPKIKNKETHGSGCTLSALIAGYLSWGLETEEAFIRSKNVLWNMMNSSYKPGQGNFILEHSSNVVLEMPPDCSTIEQFKTWYELKRHVEKTLSLLDNSYIPEVGLNFGYALPDAKKNEDICAIDGRIVKSQVKPVIHGFLRFGVSKHVAAIILTMMNYDKDFRSAINIKYSDEKLEMCKKTRLKIAAFDRDEEPKDTKSTMEWGVKHVIEKHGFIPDVVFDQGGIGKEPMIRILGRNPGDVFKKIYQIHHQSV